MAAARPLGITILGGLVALAAVILFLMSLASFLAALAFLIPFPSQGWTFLYNGLLFFVISVVLGIAGAGLLRMRAWAWGLAILVALVTLVYVGYNAFVGSNAELTFIGTLTLVLVSAVLVYLLGVSRSFRRARPVT
jgi:peptidoglycan/LPS O-acetylase OafA/YrhL